LRAARPALPPWRRPTRARWGLPQRAPRGRRRRPTLRNAQRRALLLRATARGGAARCAAPTAARRRRRAQARAARGAAASGGEGRAEVRVALRAAAAIATAQLQRAAQLPPSCVAPAPARAVRRAGERKKRASAHRNAAVPFWRAFCAAAGSLASPRRSASPWPRRAPPMPPPRSRSGPAGAETQTSDARVSESSASAPVKMPRKAALAHQLAVHHRRRLPRAV
jgi:hypothetical protein